MKQRWSYNSTLCVRELLVVLDVDVTVEGGAVLCPS